MSNSQPCQAQRSISPTRERWKRPGSSDLRWATQAALASGAPSCGQRVRSAKNSPLTWNTSISRPATVPDLLPPGAISLVVATTWRTIASPQRVDCARVAIEDLAPLGVGQRDFERRVSVIVVPMRIVGGKQQPVDADPFDHRAQVAGMLRFL